MRPWEGITPTAAHRAAYADAERVPFWLADLPPREPHPPLEGTAEADLVVVGGGYGGLWTALHAKADDPERDVVVLEADRCGWAASGRNGGFVDRSLTHGHENGMARFPDEMPVLDRLGADNYAGMRADLERHGIDAEWQATGDLYVALEPHEVTPDADGWLDRDAIRAEVDSPTYLGGLWNREGSALVHPGKLADGLRAAAVRAGVRIHEGTSVRGLERAGTGVRIRTDGGTVTARGAVVAAGAHRSPVRKVGRYVAPVYDYVLMTEPLTSAQRDAIGWRNRQGISDGGNRFHYYRQTADHRILFGGFDAVYRYGAPVGPKQEDHEPTFAVLARNLAVTFPQLEGIRFTHRWGGAIDTCSRFSVFFGSDLGGRVVYAAGYTGLGVCSTRFGGRVALDLLDGRDTEATRLSFVRRRPVPFPPEPLRTAVIQLTRNRLAAADRRAGRRGLWLGALDRLGLGFDS